MNMDNQAPSPFPARNRAAVSYQAAPPAAVAYQQGYPVAQDYPQQFTDPNAVVPGMADGVVAEARRTHARGAMIYMLAWVIIAVALPLLFASIGLAVGAGGLSGQAQDILLAGLALLAAGMAIRGVGFSLMMKADFQIRAHAWTGGK